MRIIHDLKGPKLRRVTSWNSGATNDLQVVERWSPLGFPGERFNAGGVCLVTPKKPPWILGVTPWYPGYPGYSNNMNISIYYICKILYMYIHTCETMLVGCFAPSLGRVWWFVYTELQRCINLQACYWSCCWDQQHSKHHIQKGYDSNLKYSKKPEKPLFPIHKSRFFHHCSPYQRFFSGQSAIYLSNVQNNYETGWSMANPYNGLL